MRHSREDSAFSETMSASQPDAIAAARPPSPTKLTGKAGPLVAPSATDPLSRCSQHILLLLMFGDRCLHPCIRKAAHIR